MKRKFTITLFEILPLFAGLFAVQSMPAPNNLEEYLGRYLCFILLFVLWTVFRELTPKIFPKDPSQNRSTLFKFLSISILAALLICAIFLFNRRFNNTVYQLGLTLLGIDAFSVRFRQTNQILSSWILSVLYYAGVGFLSFQMVAYALQWQAFIFGCAVASAPASVILADYLATEKKELRGITSKLLIFSLYLGPIAISILVFFNDLPKAYLSTFILLPIIANISFKQKEKIFLITALLSLLFIVNISVLAILT